MGEVEGGRREEGQVIETSLSHVAKAIVFPTH